MKKFFVIFCRDLCHKPVIVELSVGFPFECTNSRCSLGHRWSNTWINRVRLFYRRPENRTLPVRWRYRAPCGGFTNVQ